MKIEWTPTADRLPDEAGSYLVTVMSHGLPQLAQEPVPFVDVEYFFASRNEWLYEQYEVIAWAYLPEPWNGKDGEEG